MSTSDTAELMNRRRGAPPAPGGRVASRTWAPDLRLLRSELRLALARRRNLALVAVLCCAPILLGVAVRLSSPAGEEGPPFLNQITGNGLFLVFTALTVTLPFFLPLAVSVCSGESIAGEASTGTLRNLLVVPVGRTRLLAVKYAAILAFALVCTVSVALVGLIVGLALFPRGDVTLLSGTTIPYVDALGRTALVALYVTAMLAGVGAIGLFMSTLTEVPMGAMAAATVLTIASEIADAVPQIRVIHPYLFTHPWLAFGDLLRSPLEWHGLLVGLGTQGVYIAVFLSLAWARLTTKDITC